MATVVRIDATGDERLADYVSLRDVQLRTSLEAEHGLFLAEGEKVIRRAVTAGYRPRSFLMAPRWLDTLGDVLDAAGDVPCYVAPEEVIEGVTGFHVHRGALASLYRSPLPDAGEVLRNARRVVVLEDLVDHTNVGAVFRCAAALDWDAVLLSPRCADPLYRRAVKVSMGAVFTTPYARVQHWYETPSLLATAGFDVLALTPAPDAVELAEARYGDRLALLVGGEGHGLSPRWMLDAHQRVRIPMSGGVDSLNVAAATAVACYALRP
ncbi:tRNA G18 (ribose-2'-O)-methylase SpoU [Haloactinopolyspora alba]|uniref:tRNA G18 (Ribose-2'-O)-methylase SpoU n=1 Tax=Haloactinopolyspora alba TaxID=648780 RepID=A0A2P8DN71_9ACTN|nr:RNA methyltransferase [Haloactinopolyspora alba]PSK98654.1 tRNA G18 (ribose-2'-O)-methylase SpoU [Haloactinopolyspora alba]